MNRWTDAAGPTTAPVDAQWDPMPFRDEAAPAGGDAASAAPLSREGARALLSAYYGFYDQSKLANIDDALFAYHGRYDELQTRLRELYGPVPTTVIGAPPSKPACRHSASDPDDDADALDPVLARKRLMGIFLEHAPTRTYEVDGLLHAYRGRERAAIRFAVQRLGPEPDLAGRRRRLERFYEYHCPAKLPHVDEVLFAFAGDEDALFAALVDKYGPEPAPDDACPHDTTRRRLTAFLAVHCPSKIAAMEDMLLSFGPDHHGLFRALTAKYGPEPTRVPSGAAPARFDHQPDETVVAVTGPSRPAASGDGSSRAAEGVEQQSQHTREPDSNSGRGSIGIFASRPREALEGPPTLRLPVGARALASQAAAGASGWAHDGAAAPCTPDADDAPLELASSTDAGCSESDEDSTGLTDNSEAADGHSDVGRPADPAAGPVGRGRRVPSTHRMPRAGRSRCATSAFPYKAHLYSLGVPIKRALERELSAEFAAVVTLVDWCVQTSTLTDSVESIQLPKRPGRVDRAAFRYVCETRRLQRVEERARVAIAHSRADEFNALMVSFGAGAVVLQVAATLPRVIATEGALRTELHAEEEWARDSISAAERHDLMRLEHAAHDVRRVDAMWRAFVTGVKDPVSPSDARPERFARCNSPAQARRRLAEDAVRCLGRHPVTPTRANSGALRRVGSDSVPRRSVQRVRDADVDHSGRKSFFTGELGSDDDSDQPSVTPPTAPCKAGQGQKAALQRKTSAVRDPLAPLARLHRRQAAALSNRARGLVYSHGATSPRSKDRH